MIEPELTALHTERHAHQVDWPRFDLHVARQFVFRERLLLIIHQRVEGNSLLSHRASRVAASSPRIETQMGCFGLSVAGFRFYQRHIIFEPIVLRCTELPPVLQLAALGLLQGLEDALPRALRSSNFPWRSVAIPRPRAS